jgi:hypothetical protein
MNSAVSNDPIPGVSASDFARREQGRVGRPPILIYSLLYLNLDDLVKLMAHDKLSDAIIATQLDVSRVTVAKIRTLLTEESFYSIVGRAFEAKKVNHPDSDQLWAQVEDLVFAKIPGFRATKFYSHMLSKLARGEIADKMPDSKPPGRVKPRIPAPAKGRGGEGTPALNPSISPPLPLPSGPSTADKRAERVRLDKRRPELGSTSSHQSIPGQASFF